MKRKIRKLENEVRSLRSQVKRLQKGECFGILNENRIFMENNTRTTRTSDQFQEDFAFRSECLGHRPSGLKARA